MILEGRTVRIMKNGKNQRGKAREAQDHFSFISVATRTNMSHDDGIGSTIVQVNENSVPPTVAKTRFTL